MSNAAGRGEQLTYSNPVYPAACADPFVLKYLNEYWCYSTGWQPDGRCFGVFHSRDLQHWRALGGAMTPYDPAASCYWAPEVVYENGRFLLYYSVGNEERMQIRVAESAQPEGPFADCGVRLTQEDFAIDPHVFIDEDGARYLFYATDFLTHTHIGTGTVCDRMMDAFTLAGEPRPVTRARYDWQVYDPQRASKGGVRWHTIEGPFVLKRKGRYYQMFSGGNWQNASYGASYALSDRVLTDDEWQQVADGQRVLPVLRTVPEAVIGPGHNSAVRGPDNQQIFCVYHGWYPQSDHRHERVMAIDRLDWVGERLTVLGPTIAPQPAPPAATLADYFDRDCANDLGDNWAVSGGHWQCRQGAAVQQTNDPLTEAQGVFSAPYFSAEVSLRLWQDAAASGAAGVKLFNENGTEIAFQLLPGVAQIAEISAPGDTARVRATLALPAEFAPAAFQLLRAEVNGDYVTFRLADRALQWRGKTNVQPCSLALFTRNTAAAFAGFALTAGWQDLFDEAEATPAALGWRTNGESEHWRISEEMLWYGGLHAPAAQLLKDCPAEAYELVVNAKLVSEAPPGKGYGFLPALAENGAGPLLTVERTDAGWIVRCADGGETINFALAGDFDPLALQQFRLRKQGALLTVQHEARVLGAVSAPPLVKQIGLYAHGAVAAFEMVRVSVLPRGSEA